MVYIVKNLLKLYCYVFIELIAVMSHGWIYELAYSSKYLTKQTDNEIFINEQTCFRTVYSDDVVKW